MPVRLADARPPPLLTPPEDRCTPYRELKVADYRRMGDELRRLVDEGVKFPSQATSVTCLAGEMKVLGYDFGRENITLPHDVMLAHLNGFQKFPYGYWTGAVTYPFAEIASNMGRLGFDVEPAVKGCWENFCNGLRAIQFQPHPHEPLLAIARLKEMGHDPRVKADLWPGRAEELEFLSKEGKWVDYAQVALALKRLDKDVSAAVKANTGPLVGHLTEARRGKSVRDFVGYAADLAELGVLTPEPNHVGAGGAGIPPLKIFKRC